ncbi:CRTAC1 family protein [Allorhodopirellula heiligendammensis]|uniref:ASPIC and UnbV n=1 Tax=Allorhodopirellula heiligendammensis TaxID=2714739 RepID=A0A5C6C950_9BACT|nr:CRTAC1 family protein [Allorhodopirellula heiligendammensis]TWU19289.1 ASPIC and UnbV [Allorhodopirellula heiligendammensis]
MSSKRRVKERAVIQDSNRHRASGPDEVDESELRDDAAIGRAMRGSLIVLGCLVVAGAAVAYALSRPEPALPVRESELAAVEMRALPTVELPTAKFTDITEQAGIDFVHNNGAIGDKLLPETMGGGAAFFDFDSDGDQDLLMVNSKDWPWDDASDRSGTSSLYRNEGGQFIDVTSGSGLDVPLYGMGAAVGDFDNDGLVDVFITAVGENRLFRNRGDGKFEDVTAAAGVGGDEDRWSSSTGWFDFDNDGDLDLFVCNYVSWSREYDQSQGFQLVGGGRAYGRPQNFEGSYPYLYRNEGDGKFTDVSESSGVQIRNPATGVPLSKSLGLAICDFDNNGTLDLIVANDTVQNLLLRNDGNGHFTEMGALAGIAFDSTGAARGAMGIDVTSFRDRRAMAVAIGNFSNEMTALYVTKAGQMQFFDEALSTGLGPSTRLLLTFGLAYLDFDLDGRLDLFCANGHLEEDINRVQPSQHYEQPPQLFWNAGPEFGTEFLAMGEPQVGPDLLKPMAGRGATFADIDDDGDLDVLITASGRAPRLLRNDQELGHHWLRIKLVGDAKLCNRDAIGAWVEVAVGDEVLSKQVMPTRSYLSQVELPLTFGLGESDNVKNVTVQWPDGERVELGPLAVDQTHVIER